MGRAGFVVVERSVDLPGDVALEAANNLLLGPPFENSLGNVLFRALMAPHSYDRDRVDCLVELTVSAAIESVSDRSSR